MTLDLEIAVTGDGPDRIVRLERCVASLEARLVKHEEATQFSLRNLKRDIGGVNRTLAQRPSRE